MNVSALQDLSRGIMKTSRLKTIFQLNLKLGFLGLKIQGYPLSQMNYIKADYLRERQWLEAG